MKARVNLSFTTQPTASRFTKPKRQYGDFAVAVGLVLLVTFATAAAASRKAYRPETGICGAAVRGDVEGVKAYLSASPAAVDEPDRGGTPLHWAARGGNDRVVRVLLTAGAKVDAKATNDNSTPLHWAAWGNRLQVVKTIMDRKPEVDALDNRGRTPLWYACSYGPDTGIVQLLLEHRAAADAKCSNNVTALQSACFRGESDVVKLLVERGAQVNTHGYRGATALHWAVDGRQKATVEYLLKKGAQVNAMDESGRTPLRWAQDEMSEAGFLDRRKLRQIADLLRQHGGTASSEVQQNAQTNRSEMIP